MQNENNKKRFAGKGYYIALIACLAAVGISGYVFVKTARESAVETNAAATISPAVTESVSAAPGTSATPTPSATATAKPKEAATDEMGDSYEETIGDAVIATDEDTAAGQIVLWPITGDVIATFSQDTLSYSQTMADWRTHEGLDIAAPAGELVSAAQAGTVSAIYDDDYLGTVVILSHEDDMSTLYANLAETPSVAVGDTVYAGQVIGQIGNTALCEVADPDHLHFEVFSAGEAVDPLAYLNQ